MTPLVAPRPPTTPATGRSLTRKLGEKAKGRAWYETKLIPRIGPFALYGLLFTIVVLFALQGDVHMGPEQLKALEAHLARLVASRPSSVEAAARLNEDLGEVT